VAPGAGYLREPRSLPLAVLIRRSQLFNVAGNKAFSAKEFAFFDSITREFTERFIGGQ
jgi:hypothetical protein